MLYNSFPYFSGGVKSRPGRFFWHQYWSNWTLYYAAADKNHWGVVCRKISSYDTKAIRKDFGRNNVPDEKTIQRLVAKFRKTASVADAHKGRHCSSFGIIPENIQHLRERHEESPRKSTRCLSQNWHFDNISFDDPPWWPWALSLQNSDLVEVN